MPATHPISTAGHRCNGRVATKRAAASAVSPSTPSESSAPTPGDAPENDPGSPSQVLNCVALSGSRGKLLQFHTFDNDYVEQLRAGDFRTQEHFVGYFSRFIQIKLRSRLHSPGAIEDVRQETFMRFFDALHKEKIREPKSLGPYVNSICNNVLKEHYRYDHDAERFVPIDAEEAPEIPAPLFDLTQRFDDRRRAEKIQKALDQLPERDRRVMRAIFFEERDKDEVCREYGITRDNLRLILHRAIQRLKHLYDHGDDSLGLVPA